MQIIKHSSKTLYHSQEKGRSMVEMLGVLAIIGVLSVGGIAGYSKAMNKFKMECASEVGVALKNGYNGDLTSRETGSVGGQMTKKLVEAQMNQMAGK